MEHFFLLLTFAIAALQFARAIWPDIRGWFKGQEALKPSQANPPETKGPRPPYRRFVYRNPWIDSWRR
jgi:hypothetical protein